MVTVDDPDDFEAGVGVLTFSSFQTNSRILKLTREAPLDNLERKARNGKNGKETDQW